MSSPDSAKPEYVLWSYTPSLAGGVVAAGVMFILFLAHTFRLVKNRTWFCIPFVIGALFEGIGYSGRAAAHSDTTSKTPYIIQSTLILLAPILFAASIYMILGRLMQRTDSAEYSLIRATWVTKIFVSGDILCFLIQGGGAGMLVGAKDKDGVERGENIILGGLILQIMIFGFFLVVASVWHVRLQRRPTAASADLPWGKLIWFLYAASVCIAVRNICRVVEYAMGKEGYLLSNEWPLYLYDFLLMAITLSVCLSWYNPNIKPGRKNDIEFARR
ncbi:RTA1 like protein [Decorospora gaudefroyi]|uniref:RTA1 like protein n=1 Tax=Decorospora gaudefroyi TaxID=184978 RepID=A0A6A5KQB9_9PLEO|nr:RTA1 like protein [Decorospora gaudefroyi]